MTSVEFPDTLEAAATLEGLFRAGGTDLQERIRTHGAQAAIVDLTRIQGLRGIAVEADGATIGALTSVAEVARHDVLRRAYPGLCATAGGLATPQVRALASVGGNLLQATRCWYSRHPHLSCYKNGGTSCPAREGAHRYGVVIDRGPCVAPHPSSLGMALLAYDAHINIHAKGDIAIADLFGDGTNPYHDHTLEPQDIVTAIKLPKPRPGERSAYFRAISRFEAEWPLVEAIACLVIENETITHASVAVGGVATIPLRLTAVESELIAKPATAENLIGASGRAKIGVAPLRETAYKVQLLEACVLEALERAAAERYGEKD